MKKKRLPVICYWVTCRVDMDYDEMFGCRQYKMAKEYFHEICLERPDLEFDFTAEIDV